MAEIRIPSGEAWVEIRLKTQYLDPPILKLKVKPSFDNDFLRSVLLQAFREKRGRPAGSRKPVARIPDRLDQVFEEALLNFVCEKVVDWELTKDGDPIPPTEENRRAYLRPFLYAEVDESAPGEPAGGDETLDGPAELTEEERAVFWGKLLEFCADRNNFSKN